MAINPFSLAVAAVMTGVNLLVNAMRTIEGPRLNDTSPVVADYGTPLNYFIGRRLLACPSFFAKPIREVRQEHKGKGGKQVQYTGFATWAAHICDHQIIAVRKIWFDSHLVYDATGEEPETYPLGDDYDLEASLRIYYGTEDQEADPDMLSYIEARDGAGTCPAYRPTAYAYFQDVPVEKIGNRFPTVTMLVDSAIGFLEVSGGVVADFENDSYSIGGISATVGQTLIDLDTGEPLSPGGSLVDDGLQVTASGIGESQTFVCYLSSAALAAARGGDFTGITIEIDYTFQQEGVSPCSCNIFCEDDANALYSSFIIGPTQSSIGGTSVNGPPELRFDDDDIFPEDAMDTTLANGRHSCIWNVGVNSQSASVSAQSASLSELPAIDPDFIGFTITVATGDGSGASVILHRISWTAN